MADFFFFTDVDQITPQIDENKYGPITSFINYNINYNNLTTPVAIPNAVAEATGENKFRVCSLHSGLNDLKAYSVCKGEVMIQPIIGDTLVPNDTLVNLILKPANPNFINGLKVKYFIYRGLKRASILNGLEIANASTNDLTQSIWDKHNKMIVASANSTSPITGNPSSNILGMDFLTLPDTNMIADLFNSPHDYIIADIEEGKNIGLFDKNKFGLEVVTENYFNDDNLASVRKLDHFIDAGVFANNYSNKALREKILGFMDPCALYGYLSNKTIRTFKSDGSYDDNTFLSIFSSILFKCYLNFGKIYIDVRNENNLSYSYYSANYDEKLLDFELSGITPSDVFYNTNKWPIYILQTPSSFTSYVDNTTNLKLGFSKFTFQEEPILFSPKIKLNYKQKSEYSFITHTDSFNTGTFISTSANKINFNELKVIFNTITTIPPLTPSTTKHLYSSYLQINIYYNKKTTSDPNYSNAILPTDALNYKNSFVYADISNVPVGKVLVKKNYHYTYLTYKNEYRVYNGIFESYIVIENDRVILLSVPTNYTHNYKGEFVFPTPIKEGLFSATSFFVDLEQRNSQYFELGKHNLSTTSTVKVPFLNLVQYYDKNAGLAKIVMLACINLKKSEFQTIVTEKTNNQIDTSIHPAFVFIKSPTKLSDINNINYIKSQISVGGLTQNGSVLNELTNPISIDLYTVDTIFCSQLATNIETKQITVFKKTSIGNLKITIKPDLQNAISILSLDKQNLFTNLFKLPTFIKHANKLAAAAGTSKLIFKHANTPGALANTTTDFNSGGLFDLVITIDPEYLVSGSVLSIMRTIIHELMHAKINYDVINGGGSGTIKLTNDQIKKLKTANPSLGSYYCKFGTDDETDERSYSHNYMAAFLVSELENIQIEYESTNNIIRNDVIIDVTNIFDNTTVIGQRITKEMVYAGMPWQGLDKTRIYRSKASVDAASKILFQIYDIISSVEINSTNYAIPPSTNITGKTTQDFLPVTNQRKPDC